MSQPNAFVQVPPDSIGKQLACFSFVVGPSTLLAHAQVLVDANGNQVGVAGAPLRVDPTGTTTQPVSVASLPLPSGAALDSSLGVLHTDLGVIEGEITATQPRDVTDRSARLLGHVTVDGSALPANAAQETGGNLAAIAAATPPLGPASMTNASPVVIAKDQTPVPVDLTNQSVAINNDPTAPVPVAGQVQATIVGLGNNPVGAGQSVMAQSLPVALASDQTPVPVLPPLLQNVASSDGALASIGSTQDSKTIGDQAGSLAAQLRGHSAAHAETNQYLQRLLILSGLQLAQLNAIAVQQGAQPIFGEQ